MDENAIQELTERALRAYDNHEDVCIACDGTLNVTACSEIGRDRHDLLTEDNENRQRYGEVIPIIDKDAAKTRVTAFIRRNNDILADAGHLHVAALRTTIAIFVGASKLPRT